MPRRNELYKGLQVRCRDRKWGIAYACCLCGCKLLQAQTLTLDWLAKNRIWGSGYVCFSGVGGQKDQWKLDSVSLPVLIAVYLGTSAFYLELRNLALFLK